jgi:hypothetical protein
MPPPAEHLLSERELRALDALYAERSADGRPVSWGPLVEELRELRRLIEKATVVRLPDGQTLRTWNQFYTWAHRRYHALEDGCDAWIGDDA